MSIRQLARLVGSTFVGVLALGCSDSLTEVTVSEVTIAGAQPTLRIGETMQLQAITTNASGRPLDGEVVTWLTSDGSIAQVSQAGLVTGVAPGAARVSARSGGAAGTIDVTVNAILTIRGAGTGDGTVHGPSASGVSCTITAGNGNCQFPWPSAQMVPLTAAAGPSSHTFGGWSDACSGAAECQVAMSADRTVTATFVSGFVLTVQPSGSGHGAITGSGGISCVVAAGTTSGVCRAPFAPGAAVSLVAAPSDGNMFGGWGGMGCSGTAPTCQLTVSADGTVTVNFTPTFRLTVLGGGSGQGLVIGPAAISCHVSGGAESGTCQSQLPAGSPITLAATATTFSHTFTGWSGACSGTATVCQLTMTADRTVVASFRDPCTNLNYVLGTIVSGEVTSTSCATSDFPGANRHDRYAYEPTNQSLVRFTLVSSAIAPRMVPVVPANRDFGLWFNSTEATSLTITALIRPGRHFLWGGTSNPARLGSYTLVSEFIAPSAVTGCGDVYTTIGVTSSFTLGNACPYAPQGISGSFHAFRFWVNMNSGPLRVRVSSSAFAPLVELRNPQGQVVATTSGQTGNTVELRLTPISAVYINVTSRVAGQSGAFTIVIDP